MSAVTIYTTKLCPYCVAAKRLLNAKGVPYDEVDVTFNPSERQRMMARANGRRSVPQIFINNNHIGGCDELHALDRQGNLDQLLAVL